MSSIPLGAGAVAFLCLYLLVMVVLGFVAKKSRRGETLSDFYLAGRGLGGLVLFLTLYATQYSGNTVIGYPGESYRIGFAWIMSVGFMMSIIVIYLAYAPKLQRIAAGRRFVTPGDWVDYRFGSPALSHLTNVILVVSIANYLLAQLMAMGHVAAGLSANLVPYWVGVIVLVVVILFYETLGGLRAVAWTDCVQGLMLLVGLLGLLSVVAPTPTHWAEITTWLNANQPDKTAIPSMEMNLRWASTILLIGFSGGIYPHAVQRIYAAKSARTLKRSLKIMIFMPLVTTTVVTMVGLVGARQLSGLEGVTADQVMPMLLREWSQQSAWMYGMAILVVTGTLAAIMSTADSVLLSLSSMLSKDFLGKTFLRGASEEKLTRVGKRLSWIVMTVLVLIALSPRITLWGLIELKAEILAQASPVFVLGVGWRRMTSRGALAGMSVGIALAAGGTIFGMGSLIGLPVGLVALLLNLAIGIAVSLWFTSVDSSRSSVVPDSEPAVR